MGTRLLFLFFLFIAGNAFALDKTNSNSNIIPPIIVKPPQQIYAKQPNSILITQEQIQESGANSLYEILQNNGTVQLHDSTGTGSRASISLRGFGANASENSLLLIDGVPIVNPDLAPPDLNLIPLSEIERIEIIPGSEGVSLGNQAVGGVVAITTKTHYFEKIFTDGICSFGSYNLNTCFALFHQEKNISLFSLPDQFVNLNLSVSHEKTNNYRHHNDYELNYLLGVIHYRNPMGGLKLKFQAAQERTDYPGPLNAAQVRQNRRQALNQRDFFKDTNTFLHIKQFENWNERWHSEIDFVRNEMQGKGFLFAPFSQSRLVYYLKPQIKFLAERVHVQTGMEIQRSEYQLLSSFGVTKGNVNDAELFSFANLRLFPCGNLVVGGRYAHQNSRLQSNTITSNQNHAFISTLGFRWFPLDNTEIYLRRAGSFRFPKADENASIASSAKSLKTQHGISYEAGAHFRRRYDSIRIGIYQLNLQDEIAFDPSQTPMQPFGANKNLDKTIRYGTILTARTQLTNFLALDGQYNFVRARFKNGPNRNKQIPLVSEHIFRAGAHFKFRCLVILFESLFTGKQYPANDDANLFPVGGYTIFNFNLLYHYRNLEASFRINNIFNKGYFLSTVYQRSRPIKQYFYPAPERNFLLTLKYLFA